MVTNFDIRVDSTCLPSVAQAGLALLCRYDLSESDPWGFTHVAWPMAGMDETRQVQEWFFGRVGLGLIALRPLPGRKLTPEGAYAFREITAQGPSSAWIVQMGEEQRRADFARFIRQVVDVPVEWAGRRIRYASPFDGDLVLSARDRFTVDGPDAPATDRSARRRPMGLQPLRQRRVHHEVAGWSVDPLARIEQQKRAGRAMGARPAVLIIVLVCRRRLIRTTYARPS